MKTWLRQTPPLRLAAAGVLILLVLVLIIILVNTTRPEPGPAADNGVAPEWVIRSAINRCGEDFVDLSTTTVAPGTRLGEDVMVYTIETGVASPRPVTVSAREYIAADGRPAGNVVAVDCGF